MKKNLLFAVLFVVCQYSVAHQIQGLGGKDSVDVLVELAIKKKINEPQGACKMALRALQLAQQEKYTLGEAKACLQLGSIYLILKKIPEADRSYTRSAWLFEKLGDFSQQGMAYNGLGSVYLFGTSNFPRAAQHYHKAEALLKEDTIHYPVLLVNMGTLSKSMGKQEEAMALYQRAYDGLVKNNDLVRLSTVLSNIASLLDDMKDYSGSISYYEKSLELNKTLENHQGEARALLGLAFATCSIGQHEKAKVFLNDVMNILKKYSFPDVHANAIRFLAYECEHTGSLNDAMMYALQAEKLAGEFGHPAFRQDVYEHLSHLYEKKGDLKNALSYQQKFSHIKDSLALEERKTGVEIAKINKPEVKAVTSDSSYMLYVAGAVIVLLATAGFFWWMKKLIVPGMEEQPKEISPETVPYVEMEENADDDDLPHVNAHTDLPDATDQHLEVINGQGMKIISMADVWWFQKEGKSYHAFTENGQYRVRKNIVELEESLPKKFFRVNRAVIINTTHISNYSFWENHKYIIRMKDDQKSEFTISRNRLRAMKETFGLLEV
jgi:tetratricopeptide (TPR) repeat protein